MNNGSHPTIDDLISLKVPVKAKANPSGDKIAYTVRTTNWNKNRYENLLLVYFVPTGEEVHLTHSGDVTDFHWRGDNDILMLKGEEEKKAQIWMFENLFGEPMQLIEHETGVESFKLADSGLLFLAENPEKKKNQDLTNKFGEVTHFEMEESASALYYTEPSRVKDYVNLTKITIEDQVKEIPKPFIEVSEILPPMKIIEFYYNDSRIFLNTRPKDPLVYNSQAESYVIDIDLKQALEEHMGGGAWEGSFVKMNLPEQASIAAVNPSGKSLLITYKERDRKFYTQADIWHLELDDLEEPQYPKMKKLTEALDRDIGYIEWGAHGIFLSYANETVIVYANLTLDGKVNKIDLDEIHGDFAFNISDGGYLAFIGANAELFNEVYYTPLPVTQEPSLIRITDYNHQFEDWDMGIVETIEWESVDGTRIQGIMRKPSGFDPSKKYPLLFDVHGGPASFNREILLEPYDYQRYPVVQFNNIGVLILKPNYRGSIGRGQTFKELNVNNLGVGDLWDLESAIDHLDEEGYIDTENVGCMGWSQGGYISAFAGLRSSRFKAVSVGAGISDWYTYHISNDIPQFTNHYLSSNPWDNPKIYEKTAPITGIKTAKTPTLIQHGAKDKRVPLSNAMEIYRALKAKEVPVELFIYPEMAHPITKPRECRAVMQQNLDWFVHYLVDSESEPVPKYWDKK